MPKRGLCTEYRRIIGPREWGYPGRDSDNLVVPSCRWYIDQVALITFLLPIASPSLSSPALSKRISQLGRYTCRNQILVSFLIWILVVRTCPSRPLVSSRSFPCFPSTSRSLPTTRRATGILLTLADSAFGKGHRFFAFPQSLSLFPTLTFLFLNYHVPSTSPTPSSPAPPLSSVP